MFNRGVSNDLRITVVVISNAITVCKTLRQFFAVSEETINCRWTTWTLTMKSVNFALTQIELPKRASKSPCLYLSFACFSFGASYNHLFARKISNTREFRARDGALKAAIRQS